MEIRVLKEIFSQNKKIAAEVRAYLDGRGMKMINVMGAPGSGKTSLLEKLIPVFQKNGLRLGVIEGDTATMNDAERLKHLELPICHVNTRQFGGSCHIAANVVQGALHTLGDAVMDLVILENVGNLICTAEYDTGAHLNVVVLGITEGEDKPLKYPRMFQVCHLAVLNKMDIAAAAGADVPLIHQNLRQVNPRLLVTEVSARKGDGIEGLAGLLATALAERQD